MRSLLWIPCLLAAGCGATAAAGPPAQNTPRAPLRNAPVIVAARTIALGSSLDDALSPGDPRDPEGHHERAYEVALEAQRPVRFRVPAGDLDPVLRVEGPLELPVAERVRLLNDDVTPASLDALIDFVPRVAGRYRVVVSTAPPGQTGRFRLSAQVRDHAGSGPPLALGQRARAVLGQQVIDPDFGSAALFHFEAQGGSVIRLRVTSHEFDTVAMVLGPNGQTWINDDANDLGPDGRERALDSTVVLAAPLSGTYQVVVTAFGGQGGGAFEVASSVRPPAIVTAGAATPSGPFAGPDGQGRIYGVYAGITSYPSGPLYGCADDARLLGEAMRAAHLQRGDEQTVLLDAQATSTAFIDGIRAIARRARPEDVVMVFWSGHGNVVPARADPLELDGLDETIQLIDRAIVDDELTRELDAIQAGTVIVALDSCHSGGFDDVVRRAGRIGLFSSDEDVLSDTAEPRRAGGYLSYHLRRAVLGHGDQRPRDGVLAAGELTDYLTERFIEDHRLMNREGSLDPLQRLVARRGSIGWTQVLWAYPRSEDLALPAVPDLALESAAP